MQYPFGEISDARFIPLINAIYKGDLNDVKSFLECPRQAKTAPIVSDGSTALHVACHAGQVKIVKELVASLSVEDLKLVVDNGGRTALAVVAQNPALINIAECLIEKNRELIKIGDSQGVLPVVYAAQRHHKNMTRYLYNVNEKNGSMLLSSCILGGILDVALDVIKNNPGFTTTENVTGICSPIHALSRMNSIFFSGRKLPSWQLRQYSRIHVSLPDYSNEVRVNIPHDEESDERTIIRQGSIFCAIFPAIFCYVWLALCSVFWKALCPCSTLWSARCPCSTFSVLDYIISHIDKKELYEETKMHLQALEILRCMVKEISTKELSGPTYIKVRDSIFRAVRYGTVEFVVEMVKSSPHLLNVRDRKGNGIFQYAVQYRQEKIFSLLYGLDARKYSLISSVDVEGRTITHLAGLLAPSSQLAHTISPLQMQREMQWYKEVKSIVGSIHKFSVNLDGQTPDEVFTTQHKQLAKEGEEWMKQKAKSCTVVGALIITVTFTAAFTLPGGNDQNTGYQMSFTKMSFLFFIMLDALALFLSSTSVLVFLAILTSRCAEEDFLRSLPFKLTLGLATLSISIVTMMMAFCAALFVVLGEFTIVSIFVWLIIYPAYVLSNSIYSLIREIHESTMSTQSIFDWKMKPWL